MSYHLRFLAILLGIFVFITLCRENIYSQNRVIDSLKSELQKSMPDTSRVLLLSTLAFEYYATNPQAMEIFARDALQISQRIHFEYGESYSYKSYCNFLLATGRLCKL